MKNECVANAANRHSPCWARLFTAVVVAASLMLGGCYSYTIRTGAPSDGVQHKGRGSVLFWGLKGPNHMTGECGNRGVAYSRTYQPAWSIFISLLTIGIVTPWRVKYECVGGQMVLPQGAVPGAVAPQPGAVPGSVIQQPTRVPGSPAN